MLSLWDAASACWLCMTCMKDKTRQLDSFLVLGKLLFFFFIIEHATTIQGHCCLDAEMLRVAIMMLPCGC